MNKIQKFSKHLSDRGQRELEDASIVQKIRQEAKKAGATLANGGKGGLDPRLALKTFRKAKWKCQNPDCPSPKQDLDLDHSSGHRKEIKQAGSQVTNPMLKLASKDKDPKDNRFLHVLCKRCHNAAHDRENAINDGKKPPPMPGS